MFFPIKICMLQWQPEFQSDLHKNNMQSFLLPSDAVCNLISSTAAWIFRNLTEQQGSKRIFWLQENANTTLQLDGITEEQRSFGNRCISLAVRTGQIHRRVP